MVLERLRAFVGRRAAHRAGRRGLLVACVALGVAGRGAVRERAGEDPFLHRGYRLAGRGGRCRVTERLVAEAIQKVPGLGAARLSALDRRPPRILEGLASDFTE